MLGLIGRLCTMGQAISDKLLDRVRKLEKFHSEDDEPEDSGFLVSEIAMLSKYIASQTAYIGLLQSGDWVATGRETNQRLRDEIERPKPVVVAARKECARHGRDCTGEPCDCELCEALADYDYDGMNDAN